MALVRKKSVYLIVAFCAVILFLCPLFSKPAIGKSWAATDADNTYFSGAGTADNPYLITSAADLSALASLVNGNEKTSSDIPYALLCYKQTENLDVSDASWTPIGVGDTTYSLYFDVTSLIKKEYDGVDEKSLFNPVWETLYSYFYSDKSGTKATSTYNPTGNYYYKYDIKNAFFGSYDGNGKSVSGISLSSSESNLNAGLFGIIENATVSNVHVTDVSFSLTGTNSSAGGIAGAAANSTVLNCSLGSNKEKGILATSFAGGIVGRFYSTTSLSVIGKMNEQTVFTYYPQNDFFALAEKEVISTCSVKYCSTIGKNIAIRANSENGYAGGILGYNGCLSSPYIMDCYNESTVLTVGSTTRSGGIIGGTSGNISISNCLGTTDVKQNGSLQTGALFPTVANGMSINNCYYDKDICEDNYGQGLSTFSILSDSFCRKINRSSVWELPANSGNVFYYPVVTSNKVHVASFIGHSVCLNGETKEIAHDQVPFSYTFESAATRKGYSFSAWSDGNNDYAPGDTKTYTLTDDLHINPVWSLNAPEITIKEYAVNSVYDETNRSVEYTLKHDLITSLTKTYKWEKYDVYQDRFLLLNDITVENIQVKDVKDSGKYRLTVTVSDGTSEVSASAETNVRILKRTIPFSVILDKATKVYDGKYPGENDKLSLPEYSLSNLISGHTADVSWSYFDSFDYLQSPDSHRINISDIVSVGSYYIQANVIVKNGEMQDVTENYSIQGSLKSSYTINKAAIVFSGESEYEIGYTGTSFSVTEADLLERTATVNNQQATVRFGAKQGECIASSYSVTNAGEYTVYYSITAPNHSEVKGRIDITVLPVSLNLQKNDLPSLPLPTKKYDATTDFSADFFTTAYFSVVYPHGYSGTSTIVLPVSAVFNQPGVNDHAEITVTFALSDAKNFSLSKNTLIYSGSITKATVKVIMSGTYEKTYDGTTDIDLASILPTQYYAYTSYRETVDVSLTSGYLSNASTGSRQAHLTFTISENETYTFENGLFSTSVTLPAYISPSVIEVVPISGKFVTKTYDKKTSGEATDAEGAYKMNFAKGLSATVTVASVVYAKSSVGDTTATVSFDVNSTDFSVSSIELNARILPKQVSLNKNTAYAQNKTYDGTKRVYFTGGTFSGVYYGDKVSISYAETESADASDAPYEVKEDSFVSSNENYIIAPVSERFFVTISKAQPVLHPSCGTDTVRLIDRILPDIFTVEGDTDGTIEWLDNNIIYDGTQQFGWKFVPTDEKNYEQATGSLTVTVRDIRYIRISVKRFPIKTVYNAFDAFDPLDLIVEGELNISEDGTYIEDNVTPGKKEILPFAEYEFAYPSNRNHFVYGDEKITVIWEDLATDLPITVNKITVTEPAVYGDYVYTKNEQKAVLARFDDGLMAVENDRQTNAGNYYVSVSLLDSDNYKWSGSENATIEIAWRIKPAGLAKPYTDIDQYAYTGKSQSVTVVYPSDASAYYLITEESTLSAVTIGTYTVKIKPLNENYYWIGEDLYDFSDTADIALTWEIMPKVVQKPTLPTDSYTYNGSVQTISVEEDADFVFSGDLTAKNAGTYVIYATLNNSNYVWNDYSTERLSLPYKIQKMIIAKPKLKKHLQDGLETDTYTRFQYNGSVISIGVSSSPYYKIEGTLSRVNAGDYSFNVTLLDPDNTAWDKENNTDITYEYNWTILKIKLAMPSVLGANYYTGDEQYAVIPKDTAYYTITGNSGKDVGEYRAKVSLKDKTNYCWLNGMTDDIEILWSILKRTVKKPVAPENLLYTGFDQIAYIEANPAYKIEGNTGKAKGDYTATVTLNDVNGYCWEDGTNKSLVYKWGIYSLTFINDEVKTVNNTYSFGALLETPVKTGYTFVGWYTTSDYREDSKVTTLDGLSADTTLYAKWTPDATKITIEKQDENEGKLSTKLIIGICVISACFVIAVLILILGGGKKRGGGGLLAKLMKH